MEEIIVGMENSVVVVIIVFNVKLVVVVTEVVAVEGLEVADKNVVIVVICKLGLGIG